MKKLFVTSDVHSFFTTMMESLEKRGFEKDNPDHQLLICGDLFDRGDEPIELYRFLKNLDDRFIYVKGNHEHLLFDCVKQMKTGFNVERHHESNKTFDTVCRFLYDKWGIEYTDLRKNAVRSYIENNDTTLIDEVFAPIDELLQWIETKSINYYEYGNYVFVHGWIPKKPTDNYYYWYGLGRDGGVYYPDWRKASDGIWEQATWLNGMAEWHNGVKEPGKTIVCGHWHCSYYWSQIKRKRKEFPQKNRRDWQKSFEPAIDDGIIAIDACTAYTGIVNVVAFEKDDNELKLIKT